MYTNQTTHYAIPLPLGTDLTTPMDYNEAMQALDTAVWGATQDAATATSDASNAVETANQAATDVGTLGGRVNTLEATVETQGNAIVGLVNTTTSQGIAIGNKFNSVAVADAYSPTSTYSVGDVVSFEGNRYKCITAVTTGEPFDVDKWQGEDIQTVIDGINSDLSDKMNAISLVHTATGNRTYAVQLSELKTYFDELDISRKFVAFITIGSLKFNVVKADSGVFTFSDASSSLGQLVTLDLTNYKCEQWKIESSGNTYTDLSSATNSDPINLFA